MTEAKGRTSFLKKQTKKQNLRLLPETEAILTYSNFEFFKFIFIKCSKINQQQRIESLVEYLYLITY